MPRIGYIIDRRVLRNAQSSAGSRELHAATECRTILADATFRDEEESLHDDRRQWQLPL
jgi:hypothetical protein